MALAQLGYFSRTHGTKGELVLKFESDFKDEELKVVYLAIGGSNAPYFIQETKESGHDLIVRLEEVDSLEKAKTLLNKKVMVEETIILENESDTAFLGFELIDKHYGSLGPVVFVSDNGSQTLLHLSFKSKEVILPLVDDFIERIEEIEKKIFYNAPEGLIDVYLEE